MKKALAKTFKKFQNELVLKIHGPLLLMQE